MIKLESAPALTTTSRLELVSQGDAPAIQLNTSEYQERVGDQWMPSRTKLKQEVVFITEDGPVTLSGVVLESEAIQMPAAFRVVLEVTLEQRLKGAFDKGRVSQSYVSVSVLRVVEVYSAPNRKVFPQTVVK